MSTPSARSAYLMRAGLVRNVRTAEHLTTFVVSGVSTVLITRLILGLSGYPQIGGKGLHIAHVLPGGLLMLLAIFLLLSYVGPVVRPAAALVGGSGSACSSTRSASSSPRTTTTSTNRPRRSCTSCSC
jgi:hypothetical protein